MKIGITYDLRDYYRSIGFSEEEVAEFDSAETIDAIDRALKELGFETERIGTVRQLAELLVNGRRWDLIFNIAEGVSGIGREAQVPALCDAYGIPYTFSDPCVLSLTLNKELAKRVVRDLGIATPEFMLVRKAADIENIRMGYPMFAKPYSEGTGKGINASSVIRSKESLVRVCTDLLAEYMQPVLVESYLPGREFTVALIGSGGDARCAGVMEVILNEKAEAGVYSYANKENCEEMVEYALAGDDTAIQAADLALRAWEGLGCLDAGRVDVRCDSDCVPNFIEVNPLAGLHPGHSDLPIICAKAGISYRELIGSIVSSCLRRYGLLDMAPSEFREIKFQIPGPEHSCFKAGRKRRNNEVLILHQHVPDSASEDEKDVLVQRDEIAQAVRRLGYEAAWTGATLDLESLKKRLSETAPFRIFNIVESLEGCGSLISAVPALLDSMHLEYTGSGTEAIAMTSNKVIAKRVMSHSGIPTPPFFLCNGYGTDKIIPGKYIIKSVTEHASIGIGEDSLVELTEGAGDAAAIAKITERYKSECFAELFIEGREFNISILDGPDGPEILPHTEILFSGYPEGKPRIVHYRAKWDKESYEYRNTVRNFDFSKSDTALLEELSRLSFLCRDVFGLRGYARVDFRVDQEGNPWVLEVNTNPCLSHDAGFAAAAARKGMSFDRVIARILGL